MWSRRTWRLWGLLGLCCLLGVSCEPDGTILEGGSGQCLAVVVYSAITGDPTKADKSSIFRGFTQVKRSAEAGDAAGNATLEWTFSERETIEGGRNVFLDSTLQGSEKGAVDFSSKTVENSQTITLKFPAQKEAVEIGFVARKGQTSQGAPSASQEGQPTYTVGLPRDMKLNALECNRITKDLDLFESVQGGEAMSPRDGGIALEYLPIEFTNMRFYNAYASNFAIFSIRVKNVGTEPINLSDLVLEYWFDGGNVQDKHPEELFKSHCMTTSPNINCNEFDISVKSGLNQVTGAHYKTEIAFRSTAGVLEPEPGLRIPPIDGPASNATQPPKFMIEAIMNVTSAQFFAQIDVTKDYSFLNTTIMKGETQLPKPLVSRRYEPNPTFPVLKNGKVIFGRRPKSGQQKPSSIQQCAVQAKYCCTPPPPPVQLIIPDEERPGVPLWLIALVGLGILFTCCCLCICYRWHKRRIPKPDIKYDHGVMPYILNSGDLNHSAALSIGRDDIYQCEKGYPIDDGDDDDDDDDGKPGIRRATTKFHTVPSISGLNSCLLIDMKDKAAMNWDPREMKTWTGYIHWLWEPWNAAEVRRTATAIGNPANKPGQFFTLSTRKLPVIDVKVDYKTEIEPYLGEQLGEGGFGKVYKGNFRGQDVAVKVLKVDTEAMIRSLEDEIQLSSKMHNEHVVKLLGGCLGNKDNVCLIMELVEGGNLSKRIHNKSLRRLDYLEVLQVGLDIVNGLAYLHPTVIHRDLKPQNVLLGKNGRAKIADFGISKFKDPHKSYLSVTQTGGTPNYMAPELFNGTRVDEKCDIYSLGCILYEAMSRRVPLSDLPSENCAAPLFQIIKTVAIDKRRPKIPENFPADLADLVRACWKDNPRSRPSSADVCKELIRMIDEEVDRLKKLRMNAKRKDSTFSSENSGRKSPLMDFLTGKPDRNDAPSTSDGRRSRDLSLSAASSRDGTYARPPISKVRSLIYGKPKRTVPSQDLGQELDTFHSAKSAQFFSVETGAREGDAGTIDSQDSDVLVLDESLRSQHTGGSQCSIYGDDSSMHRRSSSSGSGGTISAGIKGERKGANESAKRLKIGSRTDLHAVLEQVSPVICGPSPTPPDRQPLDAFGVNLDIEVLEGSMGGGSPLGARMTNSRFHDLRDFQRDDGFAVELMEIKRSMNP